MLRSTTDGPLEQLSWTIRNDKTVNPNAADDFIVTPYPGGMTTMIKGGAFAGALARTPDIPLVPGATQFSLRYQMWLPRIIGLVGQAQEFDIMISGPDGRVANGSCQMDQAAGCMWEIAKPATLAGGGWQPTGFKTPGLPVCQWIPVVNNWLVDWTLGTIACLSLSVNGVLFNPGLPAVPFQALNWGPNVVVVQRQLDLNGQGGSYAVDDQQIFLTQQ